jgi:hypothetical protein
VGKYSIFTKSNKQGANTEGGEKFRLNVIAGGTYAYNLSLKGY